MNESAIQFITQMKLQELRRQRANLREAYQQLSAEVTHAQEPGDRLRTLYEGLRKLKFAGQPLHPEVVNLDVLLYETESNAHAPAVLSLWQQRLEDEMAAGGMRAEFVYLFGALLEEWSRESPLDARLLEDGRQAQRQLLEAALADPEPNRHHEILDPLFESLDQPLAELAERLQEACGKELPAPIQKHELADTLAQLAGDIYQAPRLRREARRFAANESLQKELADALTILIAELHSWDWPREGLATRAVWTRNRWRLYLDEDLPTACWLEIVGRRWIAILDRLIGDRRVLSEQEARLKRLVELNAPEVILENQRQKVRQAAQLVSLEFLEGHDPWEPEEVSPAAAQGAAQIAEQGSIIQRRAAYQRTLRSLRPRGDYDDEGYGGDVNRQVLLVNAEIQLARAAFPDRPLFVVKADVQDYYASLPHEVVITCLQRLGLAQADLEFFTRFLAPSVLGNPHSPSKVRRGAPMNHTLSGMLAELLMRLLERHVGQQARVRIIRLVDDICLLTPEAEAAVTGWKRIEEFCTACGLKVNPAKSGAVCLGGSLPDELPPERPRWGMLELDERGHWEVHPETFQAHHEQSRQRVTAARAVLSRVHLYNANVRYLTSSLALGAPLGDPHRESTTQAIRQFHDAFFGPGQGITAGLCTTIRERFLPDSDGASDIPQGWVYWPITAGGLGLRNPMVIAGQHVANYRKRKPVVVPKMRPLGWNTQDNEWSDYYKRLLEEVYPIEPEETQVMKTLVDAFIARGSTISAGQQRGLSSYWRWILYTYGPQILQRFGTFHFLITELVPMQLISQQRLQDTSLDGAEQPASERDG